MEGRRMAGSGHDFVITSSYLVGRRCDAAVPCATLGSCRSLGAAAALIRRRRVKQMSTSMSSVTKLPQAG